MGFVRRLRMDAYAGARYLAVNTARRSLQSVVPMNNPLLAQLNRTRVRLLERWFKHEFADVLERWHGAAESAQPFMDVHAAPIWMMWLQGADEMPEQAKPFVDSVRRANPDTDVRIVDFEDIRSLVDIPSIIEQRYQEGTFTGAHLSDYLRFRLLERYGGIWMDCSLYQTHPTPFNEVLGVPCWSVKGLNAFPYAVAIPGALDWQVYYMAARPHALFNRVMLDLMEEYWRRFDTRIDYFLTYYLAMLARSVPSVRDSYAMVPANNTMCEQPMAWIAGEKAIDEHALIGQCRASGTWLYKTSLHENEHNLRQFQSLMRRIDLQECDCGPTVGVEKTE